MIKIKAWEVMPLLTLWSEWQDLNLRPLPPQAIEIVEVKAFYVASSYEMPERDTRADGILADG